MKTTLEIRREKAFEIEKANREIFLCGAVTVMLIVSLFFHPLSIPAFVVSALSFIYMPEESILCFLIYSINFASIFRLSPSGLSFFTVLEFFAVAVIILRRKSFQLKHLFGISLLLIYLLIVSMFSGNINVSAYIKFAASLCMIAIFSTCEWEKSIKRIVGYFAGGIIAASIVSLLRNILPLESYVNAGSVLPKTYTGVYRFSALTPDPNYFVINVTLAIIALIYLLVFEITQKKLLCYTAISLLFFFGLLTYSKSAYLISALLYLYFFVISIVKGKLKYTFVLMIIAIVALAVIFSGKFEIVNVGLKRIFESKDLNDFTTNRLSIWMKYFDYYKENFFSFAFGDGIGYTTMKGAAHNTYLEAVSTFGIVGIVILAITLNSIVTNKKIIRPVENYFIITTLLIMYFFLSSLTWIDTPFQILLAFFFMNLQPLKKEKVSASETLLGQN